MDDLPFRQLIENGALLLVLVFLFDVAASSSRIGRLSLRQASLGLVIGAIGIGVMLLPWQFAPGIVFDTRSVLLSISGLFFGAAPTLIAMAMTAAYRLYEGGGGAFTGVSVIVATGSLGIAWRHLRRCPLIRFPMWELYLFGVATHLVMLTLMFTLPGAIAPRILEAIALPVLAIYPPATALVGALMVGRLRRLETQAELQRLLGEAQEAQKALEESHRLEQRRADELAMIYEVTRRLQQIYSPQALAEELIRLLEDTLHYRFVSILLIDAATNELRPFALSGEGPAFVEAEKAYITSLHIAVGQGITGYVAQTGETVRTGDVRRDARYYAVREGIRSELCVPLRVGDQIIGVLNVETTQPDAYTEADQRVLETVAAQVALAIQQAQLREEVQRYTAELEQRVQERTVQLQAANRELEAFAYSISHDLRAPLRALDGFSAALLAHYADLLDERGRHWLDRIQKASQRMGELIGDLLNLSRVTRVEFNRRPVDLAVLAREVIAELQSRDPQRRVEFSIAETLPTHGDEHLLRIALQNLLENAWKFTGPRDRPRIEVGQIAPDATSRPPDAGYISDSAPSTSPIYFVRDNGVGFDMAYADKLFVPFQRLHAADEFPGTGIGLVTVQRIVARHGGRIWPEAAVDQGATFYFTLGE